MAKTGGGLRSTRPANSIGNKVNYQIKNNTSLSNSEIVEYIQLAGIPEGESVQVDSFSNGKYLIYTIDNNDLTMERFIDSNNKTILNSSFKINNKQKYNGLKIFKSQVDQAIKEGYTRIEVNAAGSLGSEYNGYYTWLRFGYKVNEQTSISYAERINTALGTNFKRLEEINNSGEALLWWRENGRGWGGTFDLSEGSYSRKQLAKYIKSKKGK